MTTDLAAINPIISQMIDWVHDTISQLGYSHCHAIRVSFEPNINTDEFGLVNNHPLEHKMALLNAQNLQGLSRAINPQFGEVIVKWSLQKDRPVAAGNSQPTQANYDLVYECEVMQQLEAMNCSVPCLKSLKIRPISAGLKLITAVMPYYAIGSLTCYLKAHQLCYQQLFELLLTAAQVVAKLHQAGWIHGDIKPSNFLVTAAAPKVDLVVTDFALAQPIKSQSAFFDNDHKGGSSRNKAHKKLVHPQGTPGYLAPECWRGQSVSEQSDIYAFGVMMAEILTGNKPYQMHQQEDEGQVSKVNRWAQTHCHAPILRLPMPWQEYQEVLARLLAKDKSERFENLAQVILALERLKP